MTLTGANRVTWIRVLAVYANVLLYVAHCCARVEVRVSGAFHRLHAAVLAHVRVVLARVELELTEADEE
jgi:hypothetical protein